MKHVSSFTTLGMSSLILLGIFVLGHGELRVAFGAMADICDAEPLLEGCPPTPPYLGNGDPYAPPPPPPIPTFFAPAAGTSSISTPSTPLAPDASCVVKSRGYSNVWGPTMRVMGCIHCVGPTCPDEALLATSTYVDDNGVPIGSTSGAADDAWVNSPRPEADGDACACAGNYFVDGFSVCSGACNGAAGTGAFGPAGTPAELQALLDANGGTLSGYPSQMTNVCWGYLPSQYMRHPVLTSITQSLTNATVTVVDRNTLKVPAPSASSDLCTSNGFRGGWHPTSYALQFVYGCTNTAMPDKVCIMKWNGNLSTGYQFCEPSSTASAGGGTYLSNMMDCY